MLFARIENGEVLEYPYDMTTLRKQVSFPEGLPAEALDYHGVALVQPSPVPPADYTQEVIELDPDFFGGEWRQVWQVRPASPEVIEERTTAKASEVRRERNRLLADSDWTQAGDAAAAGIDPQAWAAYRRELRDVTSQPGFPWEVVWPQPPESPEDFPSLPTPRWVQFGAVLAADPGVNAMIATAASAAPVLHLMLGVGLGQAAQGDPQTFAVAWDNARSAGFVSSELAQSIATLAASYDLPAEFVAGLTAELP